MSKPHGLFLFENESLNTRRIRSSRIPLFSFFLFVDVFFFLLFGGIRVTLVALIAVLDIFLVLRRLLGPLRGGSDGFNRGRRLYDWFRLDALHRFRCRDGFRRRRYVHRLFDEAVVRVVYWKNNYSCRWDFANFKGSQSCVEGRSIGLCLSHIIFSRLQLTHLINLDWSS